MDLICHIFGTIRCTIGWTTRKDLTLQITRRNFLHWLTACMTMSSWIPSRMKMPAVGVLAVLGCCCCCWCHWKQERFQQSHSCHSRGSIGAVAAHCQWFFGIKNLHLQMDNVVVVNFLLCVWLAWCGWSILLRRSVFSAPTPKPKLWLKEKSCEACVVQSSPALLTMTQSVARKILWFLILQYRTIIFLTTR